MIRPQTAENQQLLSHFPQLLLQTDPFNHQKNKPSLSTHQNMEQLISVFQSSYIFNWLTEMLTMIQDGSKNTQQQQQSSNTLLLNN